LREGGFIEGGPIITEKGFDRALDLIETGVQLTEENAIKCCKELNVDVLIVDLLMEIQETGYTEFIELAEKLENQRNLQLKSILNDLDTTESSIVDVIRMYSNHQEKDTAPARELKKRVLMRMNECKFNKSEFAQVIVFYKKHLIYLSKDLDWHIALLKCHKFRNYYTENTRWNSITKKYEHTEIVSEEMLNLLKNARAIINKENREK
jgi:hypothetical protein